MRDAMKRFTLALLVLLSAPSLFAWGEKGHLMVGEAAGLTLPTSMPTFFLKRINELAYLNPEPDRWRNAGESLEGVNPPDHFLDYEFARGIDLPRDRYKFIEAMQRDDRFRRKGITFSESGFLPWRIAELSEQLTAQFRLWRAASALDRPAIENGIIQTAGILGHFAGDSSNPHHTTINYNGWIEPNPHHYAIDCNTHSRFERDFISHAIDIDMVVASVPAPVLRADYFTAAVDGVKTSNALVEPLYVLDQKGAFSPFGPVSAEGRAFATERVAAGAGFLRDLWWSAWMNSAKPGKRSGE
jgi:hypothetical protein